MIRFGLNRRSRAAALGNLSKNEWFQQRAASPSARRASTCTFRALTAIAVDTTAVFTHGGATPAAG